MAGGRLSCALSKLTMQEPAYFEFPSAKLSLQGPVLSTAEDTLIVVILEHLQRCSVCDPAKIFFYNQV
jgi:hypothetical protein